MKILFVDIEATHREISNAEILTLAAIKCNRELDIVDSIQINFRPNSWLPRYDDAVSIHGIIKEVASTFPPKNVSLERFIEWIIDPHFFFCHANKYMFGKNSSYDYALLDQEYLDYDLANGSNLRSKFINLCGTKSISTHTIARDFHNNGKIDARGIKGKPRLGLKDLAAYFGIEMGSHHEAMSDTKTMLEIARRLKDIDEKFFFKSIESELGLWEAHE